MNPIAITDQNGLDELKEFLQSNGLPSEDLDLEKIQTHSFLLYKNKEGELVGTGGVEFYGSSALIRSVAVDTLFRGSRYGQKIVDDLKLRTRHKGAASLFLLTETAPDFFSKAGFKKINRDQAPEELKSSSEFSHVCPSTAVCMRLDL
ncbi:MAG: GNAT family N-acetyltransferase [Flammeovirgaceae bacterium]|nr:GNAT family N-acetyltransferase [Flammeovirgaceae bacterium]